MSPAFLLTFSGSYHWAVVINKEKLKIKNETTNFRRKDILDGILQISLGEVKTKMVPFYSFAGIITFPFTAH